MSSPEHESDSSTNGSLHSFYNLCGSAEHATEFNSPRGSICTISDQSGCELCHSFSTGVTCPHKYLPIGPPRSQPKPRGYRRRSSFSSVELLNSHQEATNLGSSGTESHVNKKITSQRKFSENINVSKKVSLSGVMLACIGAPLPEQAQDIDGNDFKQADHTSKYNEENHLDKDKQSILFRFLEEDFQKDMNQSSLDDSGHSSTMSADDRRFPYSCEPFDKHQAYRVDFRTKSVPPGTVSEGDGGQQYIWHRGRRLKTMSKKSYEELSSLCPDTEPSSDTKFHLPTIPTVPKPKLEAMKHTLNRQKGNKVLSAQRPPMIDVISPSPTLINHTVKPSQSIGRMLSQSQLSVRAVTPDFLGSRSSGTSSSGSLSPASQRCLSSRSNSSADSNSPLPRLVRTPTLRKNNLLPPIYRDSASTASSSRTSSPYDLVPLFSPSSIANSNPDLAARDNSPSFSFDCSEYEFDGQPEQGATTPSSPLSAPITHRKPDFSKVSPQPLSPTTAQISAALHPLSPPISRATGHSISPIEPKVPSYDRPKSKKSPRSQRAVHLPVSSEVSPSGSAQSLENNQYMGIEELDKTSSVSRSTNSSLDVVPPDTDDYYMPVLASTLAAEGGQFHLPEITKKQQHSSYKKSHSRPPNLIPEKSSATGVLTNRKKSSSSSSKRQSMDGISVQGSSLKLE